MALRRRTVAALVVGAVAAEAVALRHRSGRLGGKVPVKCADGHIFTTIWIPGASVKSLRFLWWRYQWCPVGKHLSVVTPLRESAMTDTERQEARERADIPVP